MPKVVLDATAVPADRRGVGRYVDSLIPALVDRGADLQVLCRQADGEHYARLSSREPVTGPRLLDHPATRLVWEQTGLPLVLRRLRPDVLHSPHYTHPLAAAGRPTRLPGHPVPLVVTLHDATFFSDAAVHTRLKPPFFRAATRLALRRAQVCVVPSKATGDELVRLAGADPARLQVAYHGVDAQVFSPPTPRAVADLRNRLGLAADEDYLAFLGTIEPRKNIEALVAGWVAACAGRERPPALVLAGGTGWGVDLDALAATVPESLRLIRAGYLPVELLSALLGGSVFVAYPSLGEGFGLPVLEAMSCGAPVLTTRALALGEVGGDAVAYTEPDAVALAAAVAGLLDDPGRRAGLARAGRTRAAGFSWQACAERHIEAYEKAVGTTRVTSG